MAENGTGSGGLEAVETTVGAQTGEPLWTAAASEARRRLGEPEHGGCGLLADGGCGGAQPQRAAKIEVKDVPDLFCWRSA